jgi:hypothetical protein
MALEESASLPLPAFQRWMQQALLDPQSATAGGPEDLQPPDFGPVGVEAVINHSAWLSAHEHLAIYQRSYVARLRSCMAQQFSALEYALGPDLFRSFADDYLASFPSAHYNLAELGRLFPAYLHANRPDALSEEKEDWIDFVIELAAFEYDLGVLFDREAEEGYQLAGMDDAEDELELVPTGTLFTFQFPINTFYTRFRKGEQPDLPFAGSSYCVVLRHNYQLAVYDLQPEHHAFLGLLAQGMTVPAAKAAFSQPNTVDADAFAQIWPVWKQNWIAANLFRTRPKTGQHLEAKQPHLEKDC